MHAANPASGKHTDAGARRDKHRRSDGRRAVQSEAHHNPKIAHTALARLAGRRQMLDLFRIQPDGDIAIKHGHSCRLCATCAHCVFNLCCHLNIARIGKTVRNQRRFKRHHRASLPDGFANFR